MIAAPAPPHVPDGPHTALAVRLRNFVGDVVLSVPTLQRLSQAGFALHLVGKGWAQALLAGFGWPVHRLADDLPGRVAQWRALRRELRLGAMPLARKGPDAITFPYSFGSALEMRLAGLRPLGFAYEGRAWLLSQALPKPQGVHTLAEYWQLADALLGHRAPLPSSIGWRIAPQARERARQRMQSIGLGPGFVLACPFAGGTYDRSDKRWPGFRVLAERARAEFGRMVVLCPGPGEEVAVARRDYPGCLTLEAVDFGEYAALIEAAALVISNDTGPGHLAAAVGTPLLSVLGPTLPEHWGAWGPQVHLERRWPGWPSPEAVLARVRSLLPPEAAQPPDHPPPTSAP
ncbi:MAG: glycosyltransferase family 9 protein [Rubrivivax sp.]